MTGDTPVILKQARISPNARPSATGAGWLGRTSRDMSSGAAVARVGSLMTHRCLMLANLGCALVLAGALATAYWRSVGAAWLAEPLSIAYLLLCPQRPSHSYFPFGAQMALEQREVAMFAAQLVGGLLYRLVGNRVRPLDWPWLGVSSVPIVLDILSQSLGLRESDWLTRSWTGALFNMALVFWAYPRLDRAFSTNRATWSDDGA